MAYMTPLTLVILLAPLLGSLIAGFFGKQIGKQAAHWVTIVLMIVSFLCAVWVLKLVVLDGVYYNKMFYTWGAVGEFKMSIGFLVDHMTAFMMVVVTFVSLMVHIYSIGYMDGDPGDIRFFSYISGFTFAMLSLVLANNFLLLYFGWEGVGLVSYLLIGFWFKRESANYASLKAFIANRVGDLGFLLGIAILFMYTGSIDYMPVFKMVPGMAQHHDMIHLWGSTSVSVVTLACLLLFAGAVGKSAQIPLHLWLEGSMEGPTPISALIHAATMVTAGVYMVARLSPMFEYSAVALAVVMIVGAASCFFTGIVGIVQTDIKRVIAYSTLSQLGYMIAATGVSAFSLGLFHLMTHAAFKALLFLAAGSVIVAMHHQQDMKYMGGLRKYMPITYICLLIGALALSAIPPFAGFYSKDLIIEAVGLSKLPGHAIASFFVTGGAFITAVYTFRMFFLVFHGKERMLPEHKKHMKESPWTILLPLILLAIPATLAGIFFFEPSLNNFFGKAVLVLPKYNIVGHLAQEYPTPWIFTLHAFKTVPFWLAISGIVITWVCYVAIPSIPTILARRFKWLYVLVVHKFFFDGPVEWVSYKGTQLVGNIAWLLGDVFVLDKGCVDGSAKTVRKAGNILRRLQTGFLYHYAFVMVIGLVVMMGWYFVMK